MRKLLEKALRDAMKDKKRTLGAKQVLNSIKNSKLVVLSQSIPKDMAKKITDLVKQQTSIVDWKEKTEPSNDIYLATYDTLPEDKFEKEKRDKLSEEILKIARRTLWNNKFNLENQKFITL